MANRYFVSGVVTNNWSDILNWSTTSGGAGGSAVPLNTDDVFFDANSPNCTVDASNRVCQNLDCTGYTRTITFSNNITVGRGAISTGNVTLGAAMLFAGAGSLIIGVTTASTTIQIKSNGTICPQPFTINTSSSITVTLLDDWINTGLLTLGSSNSGTFILNGLFNIKPRAGLTENHGLGASGTATILFDGSTNCSWTQTNGFFDNPITINRSGGTLTCGSAISIGGTAKTFTHTAGTVDASNTDLTLRGTPTVDCQNITWKSLTITTGSTTVTLSNPLNISGGATFGTNSNVINGSTLNIGGGITHNATSGTMSGTTNIVLNGTGTWSMPSWTSGALLNNLEINTAGTITISGTVGYRSGIFKITAGTIVATGSTIDIRTTAATITCNKSGVTLGTIACAIAVTFNGTNGFTMATLTCNSASSVTLTFKATLTWTITSAIRVADVSANVASTITSDTGSSSAIINLSYGAQQFVVFCNVTDIDSSGGRTIYNYAGTRTRTTNWAAMPIYFPALKVPEMQKSFAPSNTVTRTIFQMCDANTGIPTAGLTSITAKYGTYADASSPTVGSGAGSFVDLGDGSYAYVNVAGEINADYSYLEFSKTGYQTVVVLIDTLHAPSTSSIWGYTQAQLAAIPAATGAIGLQVLAMWQYFFHKRTITATTELMKKADGTTTVGTSTLSDDGTTKTHGAVA